MNMPMSKRSSKDKEKLNCIRNYNQSDSGLCDDAVLDGERNNIQIIHHRNGSERNGIHQLYEIIQP